MEKNFYNFMNIKKFVASPNIIGSKYFVTVWGLLTKINNNKVSKTEPWGTTCINVSMFVCRHMFQTFFYLISNFQATFKPLPEALTTGKVHLQVEEYHDLCCEKFGNQIVFIKGYYFMKYIWRGDFTLYVPAI